MVRLVAIIGLAIASSGIVAQTRLSLAEAVELGLKEADDFKLKDLDVAIAEAQINEIKATGLPQIKGGVNYQYYLAAPAQPIEDFITPAVFGVLEATELLPVGTYVGPPDIFELSFFQPHNLTASVNVNWLVFDGSYLVGLEAAKLYREVVAQSREVSEEKVKNDITKAYINVLLTDINAITLANNVKTLEKFLYETKAYYSEGFVEQLDIERIELSLMNVKTEQIKLQNVAEVAKNVLKFRMGLPMDADIELTEDIEMIVNRLKVDNTVFTDDLDLSKLPDFKQINYGLKLQELSTKRYQKSKLPTVSAFVSGSESLQRANLFDNNQAGWIPSVGVGFNVSVPIYDGKMRQSQIQSSQLEEEKIRIQRDQYAAAKSLEVENAKLQLTNAKTSLSNAENVLAITQKIYDKTLVKYKEGVGSSIEVNQAESDVYSAQAAYINAVYTLVNAKTDLDIALGKS